MKMATAPMTPAQYLASLPKDRRATVAAVRATVNKNLPKGYVESVAWGMIAWSIPLATFADTHNKQPLFLAALASQKSYVSLHMMAVYGMPEQREALEAAFKAAGLKLTMGKGCINFRTEADLPLPAIGKLIRRTTVKKYLAYYQEFRARTAKGKRS